MANKVQLVGSLEYVAVPVQSPVALSALPVAMAFKDPAAGDPITSDWLLASWVTLSNVTYAQCLVGPSGTVSLAVGQYSIYVKVTSSPEIPWKQSPGFLIIE